MNKELTEVHGGGRVAHSQRDSVKAASRQQMRIVRSKSYSQILTVAQTDAPAYYVSLRGRSLCEGARALRLLKREHDALLRRPGERIGGGERDSGGGEREGSSS